MKLLIISTILVVFVAVEAARLDPEKLRQFIGNLKACGEELQIDLSALEPNSGPEGLKKIIEENKNKCMSKCMMEKYGVIDKSGNFSPDKAESLIPPGQQIDMSKVNECFDKNKDGSDDCTWYRSIQMCLFKLRP